MAGNFSCQCLKEICTRNCSSPLYSQTDDILKEVQTCKTATDECEQNQSIHLQSYVIGTGSYEKLHIILSWAT